MKRIIQTLPALYRHPTLYLRSSKTRQAHPEFDKTNLSWVEMVNATDELTASGDGVEAFVVEDGKELCSKYRDISLLSSKSPRCSLRVNLLFDVISISIA